MINKTSLLAALSNRLGLFDAYGFSRSLLTKSQVAILTYHRICPKKDNWQDSIEPHTFEQQMGYFCKKYEILSLAELTKHIVQKRRLPRKAIIITFDDGYMDNYLNAYPILVKYHIPATIFLTTGHISSDNLFWWDKLCYIIQKTNKRKLNLEEFGEYSLQSVEERNNTTKIITNKLIHFSENRKNLLIEKLAQIASVDIPSGLAKQLYLSWAVVKQMSSDGIDFGAHTVNHPHLTNISFDQVRWETIKSKKDIERELEKEVSAFSYPYGNFNPKIVGLIKDNGFTCGVSTLPTLVQLNDNILALGRIAAMEDFNKFKVELCGLLDDFQPLTKRKSWYSSKNG